MMNITDADKLLSKELLGKYRSYTTEELNILDACKNKAKSYVEIEGCVGVLSDFLTDQSYIYAGTFGKLLDLREGETHIESAFEKAIFERIDQDDLLERHVLELGYNEFLRAKPIPERSVYSTHCYLRLKLASGEIMDIIHRTIYLQSLEDGRIWLALCLYAPAYQKNNRPGIGGKIVNNQTGHIMYVEQYSKAAAEILTNREVEVVNCIAHGMDSQQVADVLSLSVYTVRRHRQNILRKLSAANSAEAIKICSLMGLISI